MTTPAAMAAATTNTAADRIADLDINDYARNMFGVPFSECTAAQKSDVAASMRADQRTATGGSIPADSEAATATRLATRALRAADRESVRDRDDYGLATYGVVFNALTPAQMEDVANYMRNDEKRAFGGVLAGGEASEAKRQADAAYAMAPPTTDATAVGMAGYDPTLTTAGSGYTAGYTTPPATGDYYYRASSMTTDTTTTTTTTPAYNTTGVPITGTRPL